MKDLNLTQLLRLLAVAALLSFLAACSDDDDKAEYGTLDSLFQSSKITNCGGCHTGEGDNDTGTASLTKANFRSSLINFNAGNSTAWGSSTDSNTTSGTACSGTLLVPSKVSQSVILDAISQYNGQTCGGYNYHANEKAVLSGSILDEFVTWIQNGAN